MDPVLERLQAIEAKIDQVLFPQIIGVQEVMHLTGCRSVSAQFAWNKRHGIKPYERGKYRRIEITNKVASLRLFAKAS